MTKIIHQLKMLWIENYIKNKSEDKVVFKLMILKKIIVFFILLIIKKKIKKVFLFVNFQFQYINYKLNKKLNNYEFCILFPN